MVYVDYDEVNEFVCKIVSKDKFDSSNLENNKNLLDEGTLYVAKFNGEFGEFKGSGE